jgi:hypothetical protein
MPVPWSTTACQDKISNQQNDKETFSPHIGSMLFMLSIGPACSREHP